MCNNFCLISVF